MTLAKAASSDSLQGRQRSSSVYASARYAPYSSPGRHTTGQRRTSLSGSSSARSSGTLDVPPSGDPSTIVIPPIYPPNSGHHVAGASNYALPPISALEDLRGVNCSDSEAVLRRLREDDGDRMGSEAAFGQGRKKGEDMVGGVGMRKRSLSAHVYNK
jgi:hypothetical protein